MYRRIVTIAFILKVSTSRISYVGVDTLHMMRVKPTTNPAYVLKYFHLNITVSLALKVVGFSIKLALANLHL